jgi:tetratricopeptide (TPR) repeat protein
MALDLSQRAQELGHRHGYAVLAIELQATDLRLLFEMGRWDDLLRQAEDLIVLSEQYGEALVAPFATLYKAQTLFYRGRTIDGLSLESTLLTLRDIDQLNYFAPCLAFVALKRARDRDDSIALTLIEEFKRKTQHARHHWARYLPDVIRAILMLDERQRAQEFISKVSDAVYPRDQHAVVTARAIVTEALGDMEEATNLYCDAARRWKEYGFVLEEGLALQGAGRCLLGLTRTPEAFSVLQQARELFERLEATPLVDETERYLQPAADHLHG